MKINFDFIYWSCLCIMLFCIFNLRELTLVQTFYFTSSLLPLSIFTSNFFSNFLVSKYLLKNRVSLFILYSVYTVIISLYLEILIIYFSLLVFQYFQIETKLLLTADILLLAFLIYLSIIIRAFIEIIKNYNHQSTIITELKEAKVKNEQHEITIKVSRRNQIIKLDNLIYIESLGDQLKYFCEDAEFINRDKISKVQNLLPDNFIRIHRSFIINKSFVETYRSDFVITRGIEIPISRTYRKEVKEFLM